MKVAVACAGAGTLWDVAGNIGRANGSLLGTPANRLVYAETEKALAGLSVEVLQTLHPNGPASVVRFLENCEMEQVVIKMVRRLGLPGFAGFDFMLDRSGEAICSK